MYLRKEPDSDREIDIKSEDTINIDELTNITRNVATINIQFTETDYQLYVDPTLAVKALDFNKTFFVEADARVQKVNRTKII